MLCKTLSLLLVLAPLAAQTISDANMSFTQGPMSTEHTEAAIVDADFRVAGPLSPNQAVKYWWFYRLNGDPQEYPLRLDGSTYQVAQTPWMQTTYWPNVDGRGFWMALRSEIYSTGPTSGYVVHRMTVWNLTPAPIVADVFMYADLDICGTPVNTATIDRQVHTVTNTCGQVFQVHGWNADRSEGGSPSALRASLCDSSLTTLAENYGPLPAGDYAGAFYWTWNLQPHGAGLCVTWVTCDFEINDLPLYSTYGTQGFGAGSVAPLIRRAGPAIQLNASPWTFSFDLSLAAPTAPALFLLALGRGNTTIAGIDIRVDLATLVPQFFMTDAAGATSAPLTVPPGTGLLGLPLDAQYVIADSNAWNGFASWTFAEEAILGHQ